MIAHMGAQRLEVMTAVYYMHLTLIIFPRKLTPLIEMHQVSSSQCFHHIVLANQGIHVQLKW